MISQLVSGALTSESIHQSATDNGTSDIAIQKTYFEEAGAYVWWWI